MYVLCVFVCVFFFVVVDFQFHFYVFSRAHCWRSNNLDGVECLHDNDDIVVRQKNFFCLPCIFLFFSSCFESFSSPFGVFLNCWVPLFCAWDPSERARLKKDCGYVKNRCSAAILSMVLKLIKDCRHAVLLFCIIASRYIVKTKITLKYSF